MSYNGWKNYETWCVSLWLNNDEGLYNDTRAMAQDIRDDDAGPDVSRLAESLAEYVDDLAEATCPGSREGASFVTDLLGAALSDVNWYEIAEDLLSEVAEISR